MVTTGRTSNWFTRPAAREWIHSPTSTGARAFHESLPGYAPTPLTNLPDLADELGVRAVLVKDESSRWGLPAFKVLGASWAVARLIAERTGSGTDLDSLRAAAAGSGMRLVTATDGNHGHAVAYMARLLGVSATVFTPAVMAPTVFNAIVAERGRRRAN